jgi:hypothetical protein
MSDTPPRPRRDRAGLGGGESDGGGRKFAERLGASLGGRIDDNGHWECADCDASGYELANTKRGGINELTGYDSIDNLARRYGLTPLARDPWPVSERIEPVTDYERPGFLQRLFRRAVAACERL